MATVVQLVKPHLVMATAIIITITITTIMATTTTVVEVRLANQAANMELAKMVSANVSKDTLVQVANNKAILLHSHQTRSTSDWAITAKVNRNVSIMFPTLSVIDKVTIVQTMVSVLVDLEPTKLATVVKY